jgi:hypothetical protein
VGKTYWQGYRQQVHIRQHIRDQNRKNVKFRVGGLTDCEVSTQFPHPGSQTKTLTGPRVGVDLPVFRHGPAPEEEKEGCDDPGHANEGIRDMDADLQVREIGTAP